MAEKDSIAGLIERLKTEGQLTRNTGTNSIKSVNIELRQFKPIFDSMLGALNVIGAQLTNDSDTLAKMLALDLEQQRDIARGNALDVPDAIVTPGDGPAPVDGDTERPGDTNNTLAIFGGLGVIGKAIAFALGGVLGLISGQFKAISAITKMMTPASWQKGLVGLRTALGERLSGLKIGIGERITAVRTSVVNGLNAVGDFLKIKPDSNIGKAISAFKSFLSPITKLISSSASALGGLSDGPLTKIKKYITGFVSTFSNLGGSIGRVAGLVGKLFAPIAIIMTAFETVKGAIDGYATGGILGGLQGAIDGLFTSLITKPLDLLKDGVAWILDKLGFDSSAEALNSFSFTELWTKMTDKIFEGVGVAIDYVKGLFSFGEENETIFGGLGKFIDIVYSPVNKAINFVRGLFGFKESDEPFKIQDFIVNMVKVATDWLKDKFGGIGDVVKEKFGQLGDWITGIPDRITYAAKSMFIDVQAKLAKGFLMFGEWFASIPDRIKLAALETIRSVKGGRLLVGEDDIAAARSVVDNRGNDLAERLQAVEDNRKSQLAALDRNAAAERTAASNNIVAPTINNGGNSTASTTNNYYSSSGTSMSLDPAR